MKEKILFVDDESNVLDAFRRQYRNQFQIETALGGELGLETIRAKGPYAVVVSDLSMPGMNGIQFLSKVCDLAPDTVRVMLTGHADVNAAIDAVNEGQVFRFLTKPAQPASMVKTLEAAVKQYQLTIAERELLEQTLMECVRVLTEVLALVNPEAFGRTSRIKRLVSEMAEKMRFKDAWKLETAAMLSQLGCVVLSETVMRKISRGQELSPEETQLFHMHPAIAHDLIGRIPRLGDVAEIIAYQEKLFNGEGVPRDTKAGSEIPLGARILKVASDFDLLESCSMKRSQAFYILEGRKGWYDPVVLRVLEATLGMEARYELRQVKLDGLTPGMILAQDLLTKDGALLLSKGHEVNEALIRRLALRSEASNILQPFSVLIATHMAAKT